MSRANGEDHFRRSVKRLIAKPVTGEMPKPEDAWGVWVEYRLKRLEDGQQWMLRVIVGALVAQFALEVVSVLAS